MSSGFGICPEIPTIYGYLKNGKDMEGKTNKTKSPRYFTMVLDVSKSEVVVGDVYIRTPSCEDDLEHFIEHLPECGALFACFDVEFETEKDGKRAKPVFVQWVPDGCQVKAKMLTASSADALKKKFEGLGAVLQVSETCELSFDAIVQKIKK